MMDFNFFRKDALDSNAQSGRTHVLDHRLDLGEEVAEFHVRREQQASEIIFIL